MRLVGNPNLGRLRWKPMPLAICPGRRIKTNIADSLNVIVQIERRPGIRFVSGVLEIRGFDIESETHQFESVYSRED